MARFNGPGPAPSGELRDARGGADYDTGRCLADQVVGRFEGSYPSAMRALTDDREANLAHLRLPPVHRKHVRTTSLIERSFEEERRRRDVIPRFRTEKKCLKLVFGTVWRASADWRRIRFSEHERRQLQRYRQQRGAQAAQPRGEDRHRGMAPGSRLYRQSET